MMRAWRDGLLGAYPRLGSLGKRGTGIADGTDLETTDPRHGKH
jgi:hypothetical protein